MYIYIHKNVSMYVYVYNVYFHFHPGSRVTFLTRSLLHGRFPDECCSQLCWSLKIISRAPLYCIQNVVKINV